ncbi:MAG TPA: diacylglycerol kinase family protein [Chitinophagaceae bacterium]|jgi:diacylglycerol kinase family enzyme|nr:diacylglycerol kinase family protein [Chitinophagaceae bacterium]
MKTINLLHNPTAGNEDHDREELTSLMEKNGFVCQYSSMKKDWKDIDEKVDFIVAAGGDGTIRKITKQLLDRKLSEKTWPIALLPLGTANNIAQTLEINGSTEEIIQSWHHTNIKAFDVGRIRNLPKSDFFLESLGYGMFPYLIKQMKKVEKKEISTPDQEIKTALETLREIIFTYEPKQCNLKIDGVDLSGKFLMTEIMNTKLIGPNLFLSPHGDPGDGEFEVIMIPEKDKEKLATYISDKLKGIESPYTFHQLKAKEITISWQGSHVHVDDEIIKIDKGVEIEIELRKGLLEFMVPNKNGVI